MAVGFAEATMNLVHYDLGNFAPPCGSTTHGCLRIRWVGRPSIVPMFQSSTLTHRTSISRDDLLSMDIRFCRRAAVDMPAGGQQICPLIGSAGLAIIGWSVQSRYSFSGECLCEADGIAAGLADVGVVP